MGVARPGRGGTPAGRSPRAGNPQPGADGQGFVGLRFPPQEAAPNPLPKLTLASLPPGTSGRDFTWKSRPLQVAAAQTRLPGGGASPNPQDHGHRENGGEDMTVAAASRSWGGGSCSAPLPWPQMASEPLPLSGKVSWRRAPREYTPVGPRRRARWPREACIPRGLPQPRCPPQGRHNCVSTPPHAGNRPSALRQGHGQASCPFTRWTATQWWKEQVPETRAVEGTSTVRPLSRRRAAGSQPNPGLHCHPTGGERSGRGSGGCRGKGAGGLLG